MNLKVLAGIIFYYTLLTIFFWAGVDTLTGYTNSGNLSTISNDLNSSVTPSIFQTGENFGRYLLFINFGVGLPIGTPTWFQFIFSLWQITLSIFVVGFIISSLWNG